VGGSKCSNGKKKRSLLKGQKSLCCWGGGGEKRGLPVSTDARPGRKTPLVVTWSRPGEPEFSRKKGRNAGAGKSCDTKEVGQIKEETMHGGRRALKKQSDPYRQNALMYKRPVHSAPCLLGLMKFSHLLHRVYVIGMNWYNFSPGWDKKGL